METQCNQLVLVRTGDNKLQQVEKSIAEAGRKLGPKIAVPMSLCWNKTWLSTKAALSTHEQNWQFYLLHYTAPKSCVCCPYQSLPVHQASQCHSMTTQHASLLSLRWDDVQTAAQGLKCQGGSWNEGVIKLRLSGAKRRVYLPSEEGVAAPALLFVKSV